MAGFFLQKKERRSAKITFTSNNSLEAEIITFGSFGGRVGGLRSYVYA